MTQQGLYLIGLGLVPHSLTVGGGQSDCLALRGTAKLKGMLRPCSPLRSRCRLLAYRRPRPCSLGLRPPALRSPLALLPPLAASAYRRGPCPSLRRLGCPPVVPPPAPSCGPSRFGPPSVPLRAPCGSPLGNSVWPLALPSPRRAPPPSLVRLAPPSRGAHAGRGPAFGTLRAPPRERDGGKYLEKVMDKHERMFYN